MAGDCETTFQSLVSGTFQHIADKIYSDVEQTVPNWRPENAIKATFSAQIYTHKNTWLCIDAGTASGTGGNMHSPLTFLPELFHAFYNKLTAVKPPTSVSRKERGTTMLSAHQRFIYIGVSELSDP